MKRSNGSQPPARAIGLRDQRLQGARYTASLLSSPPDCPPNEPHRRLPRTVLVTGAAKRLGREIALGAGARRGWQVAVHYRGSADEAAADRGGLRSRAGRRAFDAFQADLADEARRARPAAARGRALRRGRRGGQQRVAVRARQRRELRLCRAGSAPARPTPRAPVAAGAGAARAPGAARRPTGAVVNLLDQKLWNQNPDFFSYTLSKAALEAATTMLAQALAPRLRVVGVAPGPHAHQPPAVAGEVRAAAQAVAARAAPRRRRTWRPRCASRWRTASITGTTLLVDGGQHLMKFDRDFSLM